MDCSTIRCKAASLKNAACADLAQDADDVLTSAAAHGTVLLAASPNIMWPIF
jgi:hypothetical protein